MQKTSTKCCWHRRLGCGRKK